MDPRLVLLAATMAAATFPSTGVTRTHSPRREPMHIVHTSRKQLKKQNQMQNHQQRQRQRQRPIMQPRPGF